MIRDTMNDFHLEADKEKTNDSSDYYGRIESIIIIKREMSRTLYKTGAFERSGRSLFCAVYGSFPCRNSR